MRDKQCMLHSSIFCFNLQIVSSMSESEYPDFVTELRKRTQAVHDASDKLVNYKLALVLTDFNLWSETICDFYYVYQAIENG